MKPSIITFSIIIPVYNRPQEIDELLLSITKQNFSDDFEVIVVEDGSTQKSDEIVKKYQHQLSINYFFKENSGAGLSRNFGMQQAKGNYFIILDSDTIIPENYLQIVKNQLTTNFTHAFGGPDAAHQSFTALQKAINYAMTSFLTTGGIRGKKNAVGKFQLRSFNMGLSKKAFETTQGFSDLKIGEDIDLTFRLWQQGFETQLITDAFVFHKRRTTLWQFLHQTYDFGKARPLLTKKYPKSAKWVFWLPTLFMALFLFSFLGWFVKFYLISLCIILYFVAIFFDSFYRNLNIKVAVLSLATTFVQFFGYGLGFLQSSIKLKFNYKIFIYSV